jgi:hypothetical protein
MGKRIMMKSMSVTTRKSFVTITLVFLSMVFPVSGHVGTALAVALGTIPGNVTGVNGNPLVSVKVSLTDMATGKTVATTKTAPDGSYSFDDVEPGKSYKVEAQHGTDKDAAVVDVPADGGTSNPVALKLRRTKGFPIFTGGGGGWSNWYFIPISAAAIGAGVGGAWAAGAFDGSSGNGRDEDSPAGDEE